jgi:putative ABC transport system permease protein
MGAVGVANIVLISVQERRQEIGLRRALGATKGQVGIQFLAEMIMLALTGGSAGVVLGGGLGAALVIGALAGLLPAMRPPACRLPKPCGPCDLGRRLGSLFGELESWREWRERGA